MSTWYIVKFILTGIILIALIIALKVKKNVAKQEEEYSKETLEKARQYRENGEADKYRRQIEEAELKAFLNSGYEDEETNE